MKDIKDNFSETAPEYANFRPGTPDALLEYIYTHVRAYDRAWDCGTGSGQTASKLSTHFKEVFATDISKEQLFHAIKKNNISYKVERAEKTALPDDSIDLVTASQAVHWFDLDAYFAEVKRVCKNGSIVAVWTYQLPNISEGLDKIIRDFHDNTVGSFWDEERRYVNEGYRSIPFPFEELENPGFDIQLQWTKEQLSGYLRTWSSVQRYKKKNGQDPVLLLEPEIEKQWENDMDKQVIFPLYMRIGRVSK